MIEDGPIKELILDSPERPDQAVRLLAATLDANVLWDRVVLAVHAYITDRLDLKSTDPEAALQDLWESVRPTVKHCLTLGDDKRAIEAMLALGGLHLLLRNIHRYGFEASALCAALEPAAGKDERSKDGGN